MKRLVTIVCLVLSISACQSRGPTVTDEVSNSGLPYSLVSMPGNSRVTVQIGWPNDWAFTDGNNMAVPHIGSQLILAGGAKGYPAGEVVERFTDMKSEGYLSSSVEHVLGTLHYSPEHQEETLKMANAHLRNPTLDEQWFERIRKDFSQRMAESRSNPDAKGFEAMRWAVFGDQPLREALSLDLPNVVEEVSQADVLAWVRASLNRDHASIVIAGDLNAEDAGDAVDVLFEGLPEGKAVGKNEVEADFTPKRLLFHTPSAEVSNLAFIGKLPITHGAAEFEDILLAKALGAGSESVLLDAVRNKLRASYEFGAFINAFTREHRILILAGQIETGKIAEAEEIIRQAYADFRRDGYGPDLLLSKKPIQENLKKSENDTGSLSYTVLMAKIEGQNTSRALSLDDELESITDASLKQRLDTAFPVEDDFIVVVTSPDASALPNACVITTPEQAIDC